MSTVSDVDADHEVGDWYRGHIHRTQMIHTLDILV